MQQEGVILAAVTAKKETVAGGLPIFYAENDEMMEEMAASLANILDGMVHLLEPGIMLVVRH